MVGPNAAVRAGVYRGPFPDHAARTVAEAWDLDPARAEPTDAVTLVAIGPCRLRKSFRGWEWQKGRTRP